MPKKTRKECTCGPLKPQEGDEEIQDGTGPEQIVARVLLLCDDNTGVFFFRYKRKLYLRIVEV
jgi:hypothetical protein